jgi:L,D-transpeptidase ErfK/SrfK
MRWNWRVFVMLAALACVPAQAAELPTRGDLIGNERVYVVQKDEILHDVARRYDVGFVEMRAANPTVDPWLPGEGTTVTLPTAHLLPNTARRGIVINLADQRLYYFHGEPGSVTSYPIGIPRHMEEAHLGTTTIVRKRANPTWIPTQSEREEEPYLPEAIPPGPDNPLGAYALYLGWPTYVVHGTNKPDGVGRRVSHGCIRLYPEDIKALFTAVKIGTPVAIVDQPVKVGWSDGALYLEVHPTQAETDEVEINGVVKDPAPLDARTVILAKAAGFSDRIDWKLVDRTVRERRGIPVRITH